MEHSDIVLGIGAFTGKVIANHDTVHAAGQSHGLQAPEVDLSSAGSPDLGLGEDEAEHSKRAEDFKGRKVLVVLKGSTGNRIQYIQRHGVNVHFLQMECHFHPLVQGFTKTDNAAAADADACFLGTGYVLRLFLRCMGGAHFLEEGRS